MNITEMLHISLATTVFFLCDLIHFTFASALVIPRDVLTYSSSTLNFEDSNDTVRNSNSTSDDDTPSGGNSMSVMWYLVSFGGLVTFFLLLSLSEFCCKRTPALPTIVTEDIESTESISSMGPPPYDLFAPPSYESIFREIVGDRKRSIRSAIFLIPVHDKSEISRETPLEFGEVIRRNPMGDGEVVTPPPPP